MVHLYERERLAARGSVARERGYTSPMAAAADCDAPRSSRDRSLWHLADRVRPWVFVLA
jgi:hypothetical protein